MEIISTLQQFYIKKPYFENENNIISKPKPQYYSDVHNYKKN